MGAFSHSHPHLRTESRRAPHHLTPSPKAWPALFGHRRPHLWMVTRRELLLFPIRGAGFQEPGAGFQEPVVPPSSGVLAASGKWHRCVVLWGKDGMQYRKSVSIIEGGQTGKASCVCLPAAEWGDQDDLHKRRKRTVLLGLD